MNNFITPSFLLDCLVHMTILFSFLSILFVFVISTKTENALQSELIHDIQTIMPKITILPKFKQAMQGYSYNDFPSTAKTINNNWTKQMIITCNVFLWIIVGFAVIYCKRVYGHEVNLMQIFTENLITFVFIGAFELLFFLFIAFKYVPIAPSKIQKYAINNFGKSLN